MAITTTFEKILADVDELIEITRHDLNRVIRKKLETLEHDKGNFPLCIIVPGSSPIVAEGFEGKVIIAYEVLIALVDANAGALETDFVSAIKARDDIRHALHVTSLPTATTVYDSEIDMSPVYDAKGIDATYEYSLMLFKYMSSESRNS
jgi:hypothetical protein